MKFKIFLILIIFLFILIPSTLAIESISCLPFETVQGGTITCEVDLANGNSEKNQAFNFTFYNDTAQTEVITGCSFTGTTQNSPDPINIIQGCTIPSNWGESNTSIVNFSLTDLETEVLFRFNVSATKSFQLVIDDILKEEKCYIGEHCGFRWTVSKKDSGNPILGAVCRGDILELQGGNLVPIAVQGSRGAEPTVISKFGGHTMLSPLLTKEAVREDTNYILEIRCDCLPGSTACIDNTGAVIVNSNSTSGLFGVTTTTLPVLKWLSTSTVTNLTEMELKQTNTVSVNITNNRTDIRVPLEITFDCRINGDDDSTKRIRSPFFFPECQTFGECTVLRGINPDTTQQQATDFIVTEHPFLQGINSEAYCTTTVRVVDIIDEVISYSTTSTVFFINSSELNLEADWQLISPTKLNTIINLSDSKYSNFNGKGLGNIDIRLHSNSGEISIIKSINLFNLIKNITITNLTDTLIRHVDFELEYLEDDNAEIELRGVDLSKDSDISWWNITIEFYDFDKRGTEALEGIENKTGTFKFVIDCPPTGDNVMTCTVSAQVEDSQTVQKEVDFDCYILDGEGSKTSPLNFNQMVTQSEVKLIKTFNLGTTLLDNKEYAVTCEAHYYNLGSRTDTFSDSFLVKQKTSGFKKTEFFTGFLVLGGIAFLTKYFFDKQKEKEKKEDGIK